MNIRIHNCEFSVWFEHFPSDVNLEKLSNFQPVSPLMEWFLGSLSIHRSMLWTFEHESFMVGTYIAKHIREGNFCNKNNPLGLLSLFSSINKISYTNNSLFLASLKCTSKTGRVLVDPSCNVWSTKNQTTTQIESCSVFGGRKYIWMIFHQKYYFSYKHIYT